MHKCKCRISICNNVQMNNKSQSKLEVKVKQIFIDFHDFFSHTMDVNGYCQLFGYQHSSKYHILCLTEVKIDQVNRLVTVHHCENNNDYLVSFPLSF